MKKSLILVIAALILFVVYAVVDTTLVHLKSDHLDYNTKPYHSGDITELSENSVADYYQYLQSYPASFPKGDVYTVRGVDRMADSDSQVLSSYDDVSQVLLTEATGYAEWEVDILTAGFYQILVNYYPYEGNSSSIEREIVINGEVPFDGASNIRFHRIWGNDDIISQDVYGNDIRPSQVEKPRWTSSYVKDAVGYVEEPYYFYFNEGINTIRLEGIREPLLIDSIEIGNSEDIKTYEEVAMSYDANGYTKATDALTMIQAEVPTSTTSPTLYAINDRSSSATYPTSPSLVKLNTIGGANWNVPGDAITWTFEVPATGLHEISLRVKQNIASGMTVARNIYIDGEIPFAEMKNYQFTQDSSWRIQTLGNEDEPYLFYLTEGTHTITLEASLGAYGPLIAKLQNTISEFQKIYREIIIFTGPEPDVYRDYDLTTRIPDLLDRLQKGRDELAEMIDDMVAISGSKSEKTGIVDTMIQLLDRFIAEPRQIHKSLSVYNNNISSLGTLVILLSEQPIELDYIAVHGQTAELPKNRDGFFGRIWFSIRSFLATFTIDYSAIGRQDTGEVSETIEVWITAGKDQANIMRKLIDEEFTANYGVQVDLKLVGAALLPATMAGEGPDVAMNVDQITPVNYAMRGAAYDLTQFDDYEEVVTRFMDSGIVPYEFNGGVYALPETQIFLMMFYRSDIFEELNLHVPTTWDEVIELIPSLQKYSLEFYLPIPLTQGAVVNLPPNPIFSTMFYQNDGEFYINGDTEVGFNEGTGPAVFERWTQFYTDYSFPVQSVFPTRFRSGQMPIGITYYNLYNTFAVFAPEIRGKWEMVTVPGTYNDGELRKDTVSTGTGVMILEQSDHKDAAWEYLKWWTSTETQVRFGREMEGILGAAARYPTANILAMSQLPWTVDEYTKLMEQWEWTRGIPQVAGSYMTGRHLDNAFRKVYDDRSNARETLYDYVEIINAEIRTKRRELGLD